MMMDLADLIRKWDLKVSGGVLHIGARLGEEAEDYASNGISNVWWVEGNVDVIPTLRAKVEPFGHHVIEALVYEKDGVDLTFNVTNLQGLSSSILPFGSHRDFSPDMVFEKHVPMKSRSIDSLVAEYAITGCDMAALDLQGAELFALRGARHFLSGIETIITEVNEAEVYVGCAKVWELDEFLGEFGFERVETYWVGDQHWGDACYKKVRASTAVALPPVGEGPSVIIPSYNCGQWIERCLSSVTTQDAPPKRVVVIDDASTESGYAANVAEFCQKYGFTFLRNDTNRKCPYNIWLAMQLLEDLAPSDPVFLLDGDDFLPHVGVFGRIMEHYADPNIWLTYGNYRPSPYDTGQVLASAYPETVVGARSFRTADAHFNHPLTFRKHLWDQLTPTDLQTAEGKWFRGGYDRLIMVPMLEMSAPDHFRFIDENLYSYNAINPQSDSSVNVDLVEESREIWGRSPKAQLVG